MENNTILIYSPPGFINVFAFQKQCTKTKQNKNNAPDCECNRATVIEPLACVKP